MTISLKALHEKREQLKTGLAQIGDLRRGSLTARFRKCGKPNCHCAQKDSPGHGPSYSLTHASGGKTLTQVIPQGPAVDRTRAQIAEYRRFRELVQELIVVSEQLCNAQLRQPEAMVAEESKTKPLWLRSAISVAALSPPDSASAASRTATVPRKTPRDTAPPTR